MKAIQTTWQTMLGIMTKKRPVSHGNCFSVLTENEEGHYRIVNFYVENLEALLTRGIIQWPVEIQPLSQTKAIIKDDRIPLEWYAKDYCSVCCPRDLIPKPQNQMQTSD